MLRFTLTDERPKGAESQGDRKITTWWLPIELQRVLLLPDDLRRGFVSRVLLGLPRGQCLKLLRLTKSELDERIGSAALALTRIEGLASEDVGVVGCWAAM
jgi:hypothetical protein